jgi:hypothetical protein
MPHQKIGEEDFDRSEREFRNDIGGEPTPEGVILGALRSTQKYGVRCRSAQSLFVIICKVDAPTSLSIMPLREVLDDDHHHRFRTIA